MIRLVINIIILVALAVFIAMNVSFTTEVNFFGYKLENISTIAVILISIAVGVVYSFFFYLLTFFAKVQKSKIRDKGKKTKEKEKELKNKEKNIKKEIEKGVNQAAPEGNMALQDSDFSETNTKTTSNKRNSKKKKAFFGKENK